MSTGDVVAVVLAGAALVLGLLVVVVAWLRPPARRVPSRSHPAVRGPVEREVDEGAGVEVWLVERREPGASRSWVLHNRATTTTVVDVFSHRPHAPEEPHLWSQELLDAPLSLGGGASGELPGPDAHDAHDVYDVVIAWTAHTDDGPARGRWSATVRSTAIPAE